MESQETSGIAQVLGTENSDNTSKFRMLDLQNVVWATRQEFIQDLRKPVIIVVFGGKRPSGQKQTQYGGNLSPARQRMPRDNYDLLAIIAHFVDKSICNRTWSERD